MGDWENGVKRFQEEQRAEAQDKQDREELHQRAASLLVSCSNGWIACIAASILDSTDVSRGVGLLGPIYTAACLLACLSRLCPGGLLPPACTCGRPNLDWAAPGTQAAANDAS